MDLALGMPESLLPFTEYTFFHGYTRTWNEPTEVEKMAGNFVKLTFI